MDLRTTSRQIRELSPEDSDGMFQLRREMFSARLGWQVQVTEDGLEIDEFDGLESVRYLISLCEQRLHACCRLLPTEGPNMLADVFSYVLQGAPVPRAPDIWEISRFAIGSYSAESTKAAVACPSFGFGKLALSLVAEAWRFARRHGVSRYVAVTTTPFERLLKKEGLTVYRLAPPMRVGNVMTVACAIEVDDNMSKAVKRAGFN